MDEGQVAAKGEREDYSSTASSRTGCGGERYADAGRRVPAGWTGCCWDP